MAKRGGELILVFFLLVNIFASEYEVNVIRGCPGRVVCIGICRNDTLFLHFVNFVGNIFVLDSC